MTTLEMPETDLQTYPASESQSPTLAEQSSENPIADEAAAMVEGGGDEPGITCDQCEGTGFTVAGVDAGLPCSDCSVAEVPPGVVTGESPADANPCDGSTSPHEPPPLQHGMATVEDEAATTTNVAVGTASFAGEVTSITWKKTAAELLAKRNYESTLREAENAYVELSLIRAKIQSDLKAAKEVEKEALERVQDIHDKGWRSFMRKEESGVAVAGAAAGEGIGQGGESGNVSPPTNSETATLAEPAAALAPADWRLVSIDELGLKGKFIDKLKDADAGTMGGLEDLRTRAAANPTADVWPQGIGPKKIEAINNALIEWMAKNAYGMESQERTPDPTLSPTLAEPIAASGDDLISAASDAYVIPADDGTGPDAELLTDDPEEAARIAQILKRAEEIEWEFPADGSGPKPLAATGKKFRGHFEDGGLAYRKEGSLRDCNWIGPSEEQDNWLRGYIAESRKDEGAAGASVVTSARGEMGPDEPAKEAAATVAAATTMEVGEVNVEDL